MLDTATRPQRGVTDTQAKRKADRRIDNARSATFDWLGGWCKLPAGSRPLDRGNGRNAKLMAYLDEVSARARAGERYSLKEIQREFGIGEAAPPPKRRKRR